MHWLAQAPANIALIKYMGKKDSNSNLPDNSSLSYTLNNLLSTVKLEVLPGKKDIWEPLITPGGSEFKLSVEGQKRFIEHLALIKSYFHYQGGFLIQSSNNFPHGSGLASSASSFAALTKCASLALSELTDKPIPSVDKQAQLSRLGSGSSCRSFYSPWALWKGDTVTAIDLPYKKLIHQVIVISGQEKNISSSEAHKRVKSSNFYSTRGQRAEENLKLLLNALRAEDWSSIYEICWHEFQDMHRLFSSCEQPFSYITKESQSVLNILHDQWQNTGDGPIVTMDAGPNIHLLYRPAQEDLARQFKSDYLVGNYDVL
ncbi:diphosphomevalonate decarboxylase [Legionella antarctica]|uniref:Diphosphomevalonate decarboxylase n=1 Tax=Legionella antarctica TaxID=2708020 RepID=A0A6F8T873_9GAMM|nr:diphosphomevalonate decarboxylase [Legionella antarctica]BCA96357.1 diphosphomevalonate decarboxylase [Legionella antarctica]